MMIGTGAAMAGLGGLAAAAVTVNNGDQAAAAKAAAAVVETRTVVVRTVEHRVKRLEARHDRRVSHPAAAAAAAPAPVVQAAPVSVAQTTPPVTRTAPIRTSTSGSSGRGDDAAEHENAHQGGDNGAEHTDD
jgi:hypothetical protein